jgi:predicted MFS family arabinose efflux permease
VAGVLVLIVFIAIERTVAAPLVPVQILGRRTVAWGNLAGILAFATETSLVFVLTLYLQKVLGFSPLTAGLSFAVLGLGTVLGGVLGPKVIGRLGNAPRSLAAGMIVQAAATAALVLLGTSRHGMALLLIATFIGGVANLVAIVGFLVTATSGLPDQQQGLAAGLATMSQQIGITLGIPIMAAVIGASLATHAVQTPDTILTAVRTAVLVNTALCVITVVAVALARRVPRTVPATADPA